MKLKIQNIREGLEKYLPAYVYWILWNLILLFFTALCSQMIVEYDLFYIGSFKIMLEMMAIEMLILLFYIISGRLYFSAVAATLASLLLTVANYFVAHFRGTELMPLDVAAVSTAANVASNYEYKLTEGMARAFVIWIIIILIPVIFPRIKKKKGIRPAVLRRLAGALGMAALLLLWIPMSSVVKMETYGFNGSKFNGYLLNFSLQLKAELSPKMPKGYSLDIIRELEKEYGNVSDISKEDHPDIIFILEESFADISLVGGRLNTEEEVIPYWNSISENAIKGYQLSSMYGGGTANAEWEALTGNTMGFLGTMATPYQLYINDPTYSVASYLKEAGYICEATHPYYASGWQRKKIYPLMGFDSESFVDRYPKRDIIRKYVSDREMFEHVIRMWEEKEESEKLFIWGITMQNHGGYRYSGEGYTPTMPLSGYSKKYNDAEQYLGLLKESDKAIEYLISYFEKREEPVVICIFGDHFPNVSNAFLEELHGGEFETLDEEMKKYTVPFVVWTNYDMEEQDVPKSSMSMLSYYLYEAAGIEQPAYNRFLKDFSKVIPEWNALGYYSMEEGRYKSFDEATGIEEEWIFKYKCLQYNSLFDTENRSEIFFPVKVWEEGERETKHKIY